MRDAARVPLLCTFTPVAIRSRKFGMERGGGLSIGIAFSPSSLATTDMPRAIGRKKRRRRRG